jgi:hypothetical protein
MEKLSLGVGEYFVVDGRMSWGGGCCAAAVLLLPLLVKPKKGVFAGCLFTIAWKPCFCKHCV